MPSCSISSSRSGAARRPGTFIEPEAGMRKHIAMIALAIGFAGGCGGSEGDGSPIEPPPPPPAPAAVTVTTGSTPPPRFIPVNSTVAVGGTVTFRNGSPAAHDVTSESNAWLARTLNPSESFQVTFAQAGVFPYRCTLHEGMNGSIEVK